MYQIKHLGRLPRIHDPRDYSPETALKEKIGLDKINKQASVTLLTENLKKGDSTLKPKHSNSSLITQVEDQGNWGSCVGFGCNYGLEIILRVIAKRALRFSARYTYRQGRYIANLSGDSGLWVRNGLGSLARYGAVEEARYPYDTSKPLDEKVDPDLHPLADDFKALKYFRLDYPNVSLPVQQNRINKYISQKFPVICGFYCFDSLFHESTELTGNIPYPSENEGVVGGHCVCLTGYDDNYEITNPIDGKTTRGAWEFVNSWGTSWSAMTGGYGHLPYDYLTNPMNGEILADEFYTFTKASWLEVWDFD
jgi:C1A family cysteine protease